MVSLAMFDATLILKSYVICAGSVRCEMGRLTIRTKNRAALKLDNPQNESEARKQLHDKYLIAIDKLAHYEDLEEAGRLIVTPETGIGDLSDGYHTFNELYHHRAVLFSVICDAFKPCAWKSKMHSDGTMYDGMFIVGIDTPEGSATYHYDIEPYWNMFDVKELGKAPEWDGHTPDDAINRLAKLKELEGDHFTDVDKMGKE